MKTNYRYTINGKPTEVELEFADGMKKRYETDVFDLGLSDVPINDPRGTVITLDEPVETDYISIKIFSAVEGTKYKDTAISEIEVYGSER